MGQYDANFEHAHRKCTKHRLEIESSRLCGCFYCLEIFTPDKITEWTDENHSGIGQTAICPFCGVDSIIGNLSGSPIDPEFLKKMHRYWFC